MSISQGSGVQTQPAPGALLVVLVLSALIFAWIASQPSPSVEPDAGATGDLPANRTPVRAHASDADAFALVPQPRRVVPPRSLFAPIERPAGVPEPAPSPTLTANTPLSVVAPAPPVQTTRAPPLPFAFLGRLSVKGRWTVLLERGKAQYMVRDGDVIDAEWRVDAIDEAGIEFTYLPLGTRQRLLFNPEEAPGIAQSGNDGTAHTLAHATESPLMLPSADTGRAARPTAISSAARAAVSDPADEQAARSGPPPAFERRIRPSDIPREPWVCVAARANALVPCRNTWSMSEVERVACRKTADQRYNACLSANMSVEQAEN